MIVSTTNTAPSHRKLVLTGIMVASLGLAAAGCSSGSGEETEPTSGDATTSTIPGAAGSIADGSADGVELDNLNVPGTETDAEVDDE